MLARTTAPITVSKLAVLSELDERRLTTPNRVTNAAAVIVDVVARFTDGSLVIPAVELSTDVMTSATDPLAVRTAAIVRVVVEVSTAAADTVP